MRFNNIEVSGINRIVIAHKAVWEWNDGIWVRGGDHAPKHHGEMMEMVNRLKSDRRYRMWVHWNTLNILKVTE
jgi:hypothetical protein